MIEVCSAGNCAGSVILDKWRISSDLERIMAIMPGPRRFFESSESGLLWRKPITWKDTRESYPYHVPRDAKPCRDRHEAYAEQLL